MRKAKVSMHEKEAGVLTEFSKSHYTFEYVANYQGEPVSLTLPVQSEPYTFSTFPTFFEGLLPEGYNRDQLLIMRKMDAEDYFSMLMYLGQDVVGAATISEISADE